MSTIDGVRAVGDLQGAVGADAAAAAELLSSVSAVTCGFRSTPPRTSLGDAAEDVQPGALVANSTPRSEKLLIDWSSPS